jgi:hypothetical protein
MPIYFRSWVRSERGWKIVNVLVCMICMLLLSFDFEHELPVNEYPEIQRVFETFSKSP